MAVIVVVVVALNIRNVHKNLFILYAVLAQTIFVYFDLIFLFNSSAVHRKITLAA